MKGSFVTVDNQAAHLKKTNLAIALVKDPQSMEPTSLDSTIRTLALQVYEPLVRTDRFLKIEPALARAWGRTAPDVWEFQLRDGISFHNNKILTVDDVMASFRRAENFGNSDLKGLLSGITLVPKNGYTFEIHTLAPDPLLLQKISAVLIFPKDYELKTSFAPIGTGSYLFSGAQRGEYSFTAFPSYWGVAPTYPTATFSFYPDKNERAKALQSGSVDIVQNVPPEQIKSLKQNNFHIDVVPSLEVNFLLFNMKGVFKTKALRQAASLAIDHSTFEKYAGGYVTAVNQFVSSGVFGYNPQIPPAEFNIQKATDIVKAYSEFDLVPIKLSFVKGLETAGDYVAGQLRTIGFDPTVTYVSWSDFRSNLAADDSDLFFFGWKSDLGSASDFYLNAVHSRNDAKNLGQFNAGKYANTVVDNLIDLSVQTFDNAKRLSMYQQVMKILIQDHLYGVPLFESQTLYASKTSIKFEPRIDGYIIANQIY